MPQKCSVCAHSEREAIDSALVGVEQSLREIATRFELSKTAVHRHSDAHVPETLLAARDVQATIRADRLLADVLKLRADAERLLAKAEAAKDFKGATSALREARACVELLARLAGKLEERLTVNVLVLPEWQAIRGALLAALWPYPEARAAVAAALQGLPAGEPS